MGKTKIEYGGRTWNPLTGCTVLSEGCKHCWAREMAKRLKAMGRPEYQNAVDAQGNWTGKITLLPERLKEPLSWRTPQHVLVEYMGDLFHQGVPDEFIWDIFTVIWKTPQHTYQTLTKRPERMIETLFFKPCPNAVIGCTVENQKRADERLPFMRKLSEWGWRIWVSYEPALGNVDWTGWEFLSQLVTGGESGKGARPMHPDWARDARDWCVGNGVPFFFKQWGEWMPVADLYTEEGPDQAFEWIEYWEAQVQPDGYIPVMTPPISRREGGWHEFQPCPGTWVMAKVGKKKAGRILDGRTWDGLPRGKI